MTDSPPPGWWQASDGKWYLPPMPQAPPPGWVPPPSPGRSSRSGCLFALAVVVGVVLTLGVIGAVLGGDDAAEVVASTTTTGPWADPCAGLSELAVETAERLLSNPDSGERFREAPGTVTRAVWATTQLAVAAEEGVEGARSTRVHVVAIGLTDRPPVQFVLASNYLPPDAGDPDRPVDAWWYPTEPLGPLWTLEDARWMGPTAADALEDPLLAQVTACAAST